MGKPMLLAPPMSCLIDCSVSVIAFSSPFFGFTSPLYCFIKNRTRSCSPSAAPAFWRCHFIPASITADAAHVLFPPDCAFYGCLLCRILRLIRPATARTCYFVWIVLDGMDAEALFRKIVYLPKQLMVVFVGIFFSSVHFPLRSLIFPFADLYGNHVYASREIPETRISCTQGSLS